MPVEYCAVGLLLELLAEEDRVEDDALGVDAADAELLQELAPALAVERDERVVRRLPVERRSRGGVDVREHEVDVVLRQRVEGRALDEDPPDLLVVALDVGLLLRVVRVAEEHVRAPLELRWVVLRVDAVELDHLRVRELRPVVGENDGEERLEELRPRHALEHVEDARRGLRGVRVPEEREHEAAREHQREQDLASDGPDDSVELHGLYSEVEREERAVLLVGAPDAALRVGLRDRDGGLVLPRPPGACLDEVGPPHGEEPRVHQPVDGALAEAVELLLRGGHDHADGLPAELDRGEQRVAHVCPLLVGGVGSPARLDERPAVVRLRGVRDVVALPERAGGLPVASVAHVGCVSELQACPLAEVLAHLEALLLVLERHLPPVRVAVHLRTRLEVLADRVCASVALVAPAHAVLHLVRDRRDRAREHRRHLGEGQSAFEPVGYAFPRV